LGPTLRRHSADSESKRNHERSIEFPQSQARASEVIPTQVLEPVRNA
jgi:hypothetical protein